MKPIMSDARLLVLKNIKYEKFRLISSMFLAVAPRSTMMYHILCVISGLLLYRLAEKIDYAIVSDDIFPLFERASGSLNQKENWSMKL